MTRGITGTTRIAAVLGYPVEHSRSPQMLNAAFAAAGVDAVMVPVSAPPERFAAAVAGLRAIGAIGASVTVPHKLAAAALCDELSPAARAIGAVNCLQFDGGPGGRLVGHNTDSGGFVDGLLAADFDPIGAHAVLLGAGGAARGVAYGLVEAGAEVEVIARHPDRVTWAPAAAWTDAALRDAFRRAGLVVDCTSVGLEPGPTEVAFVDGIPLDELAPDARVATLVYHRSTILLERAEERDHSTVDGRAMLVHQGARAFAIWTGRVAPLDEMTRALDEAIAARGT